MLYRAGTQIAELREYIMSLDDDISMKPTKLYVGFQLNNHNLVDIKLQRNSIVLWLNTLFGTLDDPRGLITDVTHIGHHGNGDCQIKIKDNQHMGYIKEIPHKRAACLAVPFPPCTSCKFLDLPPASLRNLQARLTEYSLASQPPLLCGISLRT